MALSKLMTNLMPEYYAFVRAEAKAEKKTIRQILEDAIRLYQKEKRKKRIIQDCERLANDTEYLEEMRKSAEMGMVDYWEIITRDEQHDQKI